MKKLKVITFSFITGILAFTLATCESLTKATENIASAEGFGLSATSLFSSINAVEEINQLDGKRPAGSIGIANEKVNIIYTDSLLTDGNGISYTLDYGSLGTGTPKGTNCGDGVYRAGKIYVNISGAWAEPSTAFTITFESFSTGDGANMNQINGTINGKRNSTKSWKLDFNSVRIGVNSSDASQEISGECEIVTTAGDQTIGLLDNTQDVFGSGTGVLPSGEVYSWEIDPNIPLVKRMEFGCAQTFVKGVVKITNADNQTQLQLDFDPYENKACDRVAKALIGRREFIFTIK